MNNICGIILAAGRGSRMGSLTESKPKCLQEVNGRTLLQWQVSAFIQAGVSRLAVVTGYKHQYIKKYLLENFPSLDIKAFNNPDWASTQMSTSLLSASSWLETNCCLISYSDIIYESIALKSLLESNSDIAISYDVNWLSLWERRFNSPLLDAESFKLDADGSVIEIGNEIKSAVGVDGQYMGILKFTPIGWQEFKRIMSNLSPDVQDNAHITSILQGIISGGRHSIGGISYQQRWAEIDTADDLRVAQEIFLGADE